MVNVVCFLTKIFHLYRLSQRRSISVHETCIIVVTRLTPTPAVLKQCYQPWDCIRSSTELRKCLSAVFYCLLIKENGQNIEILSYCDIALRETDASTYKILSRCAPAMLDWFPFVQFRTGSAESSRVYLYLGQQKTRGLHTRIGRGRGSSWVEAPTYMATCPVKG